ncbi:MAG: InlB B-repeat-containing protein, partial [Treponema sp.]|nr:InlB B-repeat-containing protein [Treponema sp.]
PPCRLGNFLLLTVIVLTGFFAAACENPVDGPQTPPAAQYTLTFNTHGGSAVAAISAAGGTQIAKPTDPTRSGFTFTGWFSAETGGTLYAWPHTLTANVTMHAQGRRVTCQRPANIP